MSIRAVIAAALLLGCQTQPQTGARPRPDAAVLDAGTGDGGSCASEGEPLDIDLLFVVGNGARSRDTQTALLDGVGPLLARLECDLGVRPDLHIGVTSTDLGAGGFDIPNCTEPDDGDLLAAPALSPDCPAPDGAFIRDLSLVADLRDTNYEGELTEAVQCIAALGTGGCVFEQPLAAAVAATDPANADNAGFVRDGALLAVVLVGAGDDCSAADPGLFDPAATGTLGPLDPFRCFEAGVACDPDEPRAPGVKSGCEPRSADNRLTPIGDLAAALASRKADPADLLVAGIGGRPVVVVIESGGGQRTLGSSCAPTPLVDPPIRIGAAIEALGGFSDDICDGPAPSFDALGAAIAAAAISSQRP